MKQLIVFILLLLLLNCVGKSKKPIQIQDNDTIHIAVEDFNEFYNHFVNDSIFQISRVVFPIKAIMIRPPKDINDTILPDSNVVFERGKWHYLKNVGIDISQYEKEFKLKNDSIIDVIISAKYFDNYIERTFVKRKGKWYLFSFYESSLNFDL